jgi:hypothetical protein
LIDRSRLVLELICGRDDDECRADDEVVGLEEAIKRSFREEVALVSANRVARSRGDKVGSSSSMSMMPRRTSSGMRFHIPDGFDGLSCEASTPPDG